MKQQCLGVYVADQGRHWPGTHGALAASCLRCPAGREDRQTRCLQRAARAALRQPCPGKSEEPSSHQHSLALRHCHILVIFTIFQNISISEEIDLLRAQTVVSVF